jgi:hypothetical protein
MMEKKNQPPSTSQLNKFQDLARDLGCDEDEDAFKAKLRKIAKSPPQHREKPKDEAK